MSWKIKDFLTDVLYCFLMIINLFVKNRNTYQFLTGING